MPVILAPQDYARWLDPDNHDTASLKQLLAPRRKTGSSNGR
jgi:putative SOS response-associated peptidase YedK